MTMHSFCLTMIAAVTLSLGSAAYAQQSPGASQPSTNVPTANTPPPAAAGIGDSASSAYVLGRDDVVDVSLVGRSDFGGRARVQADGTIQLPLIGKIQAAERTTAELSETIRKALQTGGFFPDPVVAVEVSGYASRYVTVLGAVGNPGLIPMNRPYRMSEILARVGGVRETAADYITVISANGEEKRLPLQDISSGRAEKDPYVSAGDKIFSPPAPTYFIYGKVNSPGEYPLKSDLTLRMAIAKSGGLQETGSDKKVATTRGGKKVKVKLDDKIEPGDVLVVGERLF
ncbi:polysaccharide biosynthesis/export family protein [Phenylobacterium sp. RIFCSPHIGHO2_01_FULL_69_31]|uniref:polysaccharide biosynthesis/export family protein n=1 Tax=Phenylobacterium sp. RIFCSPHIGHO2_01_FULL_69_31 TaxID=1801944 RepID=UPI000A6DF3B2|nr:polysaccharide biosynthesis/export family protein [Phenylobacterium sp. RIFCSPHIGHO2_01_FULL_69_31]